MKKCQIFWGVVLLVISMLLLMSCSKNAGPIITEDEVVVTTGQMDVHFTRSEPFAKTYMIFGGHCITQEYAISKVALSTLSMEVARPIYWRYPDFTRCASPGAFHAKKAIRQMNIVPADSHVLAVLKEALAEHARNLESGSDNVCLKMEGAELEMTAAIIPRENMDIMDDLPPQARRDYYLVQSADIVDAATALAGR
jgi:hypothetical protein